MLMSTQASRLAHALIKARMSGTLMPLLSTDGKLTVDDAYDVALSIVRYAPPREKIPSGARSVSPTRSCGMSTAKAV